MQKIEKQLKQKLTNELEDKLTEYSVEFSLQNDLTNKRRISKNQYKLINEKLYVTDLKPKFPCFIKTNTTSNTNKQNLSVNKKNGIIVPEYFKLKNKSFSPDTFTIAKTYMYLIVEYFYCAD